MLNLFLHKKDFGIDAVWTFTSSGHGKSSCDGLGAVVKSAARKHLLKQGPEAAFCSARDFYQFTLDKTSRTLSSTKSTCPREPSNSAIGNDNKDYSSDEEIDTIASRPKSSIEVRWLDEEEVEDTFQKVLKIRWSKLSPKSNNFISPIYSIFLLAVDRIVGIRSFHEFDATSTRKLVCRSVSPSINPRAFHYKLNTDVRSPIIRVLDTQNFIKGIFLIVEQDDVLYLAQISAADLKKSQLTVSIFSPPLPAKKFSISKSAPLIISTINVIGCLVDIPTRTRTHNIILSDKQFLSIQDLCDEF